MARDLLDRLGLTNHHRVIAGYAGGPEPRDGIVGSVNPATGKTIAGVRLDTADSYEETIQRATAAFKRWRAVPAPKRGEVVRAIGDELRARKEDLGRLVSLEVGKILAEGIGEVQETVDIADFAVGLSRQLYGLTMPSERPQHAMREQWLPLGPIGVITAFNFPNAVWGWNAMLAAVCGDVTVWKPSLLAPLTAIATNEVARVVAASMGHQGIFELVIGTDEEIGERMIADKRVPLISATGSCRMGRHVSQQVAARLGRCLLELGGNNAVIVEPDADLDLALKGVVFGSVGTCGQRCTTTRRLIIHESIADAFYEKLAKAYETVKIGDPLAPGTLVGPLINERAAEGFERAIAAAKDQGGQVLAGGNRVSSGEVASELSGGTYVRPTVVRAPAGKPFPVAQEETFAPILYVFTYRTLDEAIELHNSVDQGLSSAIYTGSVRSAERFLDPSGSGSDCGLAYVNLGTSGAEIGGAFGGEKDTGGGRESGSDSWKAYMRRQTCTINFGETFALAQGIRFE
ncbi:MAG: aldehyde dehydrogenase family protein [Phycisphaeraceae bacterium]|nr:aldehyde dehydrogenase family protein [Phycisphaeraceae bacterium]